MSDKIEIPLPESFLNTPIKSIVLGRLRGDHYIAMIATDGRVCLLYNDNSCCEHVYFATDDEFVPGSKLLRVVLADYQSSDDTDSFAVQDTAFLRFYTDSGVFVVQAYNEHNGYYAGFSIRVAEVFDSEEDYTKYLNR